MRRWLDRLYGLSGVLAAVALAGIAVVMLAQALGRELGAMIRGADDIAAWLCAASAFLGLAHTFRNGEMIRVGLLLDALRGRRRWWAEVFSLAVMAAFVGYGAWAVVGFVVESWKMKEVNQGLLQLPVWIPQSTLAVGMCILLVAVLDELWAVLNGRKPGYQLAQERRKAGHDFSEAL